VDAFQVLGLPYDPDVTNAEVRAAYLVRLRAVHPDNGGDTRCAAAVTAAFESSMPGVTRLRRENVPG
jgi:curved DNA-binding protein CbpA